MPEPLHDRMNARPFGQHERCGRVAQLVETHRLGYLGFDAKGLERLVYRLGVQRLTCRRGEHEAHAVESRSEEHTSELPSPRIPSRPSSDLSVNARAPA